MQKKEYVRPSLDVVRFLLTDIICNSPETSKTVIDDGGDWGSPEPGDDDLLD